MVPGTSLQYVGSRDRVPDGTSLFEPGTGRKPVPGKRPADQIEYVAIEPYLSGVVRYVEYQHDPYALPDPHMSITGRMGTSLTRALNKAVFRIQYRGS